LAEVRRNGQLIVEEYDTTIVVPPGATVRATSGIVRMHLDEAG
jgi:N-methylhydantoinase A/oxoprolinase/acetone carboxylase beta subunit